MIRFLVLRLISGFWYSNNMEKGTIFDSANSPTAFSSPPPDFVYEVLINLACKK